MRQESGGKERKGVEKGRNIPFTAKSSLANPSNTFVSLIHALTPTAVPIHTSYSVACSSAGMHVLPVACAVILHACRHANLCPCVTGTVTGTATGTSYMYEI